MNLSHSFTSFNHNPKKHKLRAKMAPTRLILIILVTICFLSHYIQSFPTYVYHYCTKETVTGNSTYQSNLNKVLTTLSANATSNKNGFFNFSVTGHDLTTVYGLYMCRGDITEDRCSTCVTYGVKDVSINRCPNHKEAYIWYDECSLRYSDNKIFGSDQEDPSVYLYNVNDISEPNKLAEFIETTMAREMANQAASDMSGKKFATKQVKLSKFHTLYSLVQCTPDIRVSGCIKCIKTGVSNFPSRTKGARVLLPSCVVRYETYPFYNFPSSPPPVLIPSPPPSAMTKEGITAKVIVGITIPGAIVALLVITGVVRVILTKRANKKPDGTTYLFLQQSS